MARDKAEDAGGLTPAKDDNAAQRYFNRRTLPIFRWVDYMAWSDCSKAGRRRYCRLPQYFARRQNQSSFPIRDMVDWSCRVVEQIGRAHV